MEEKYWTLENYCKVTTTDNEGNIKDIWLRQVCRKPQFLIDTLNEKLTIQEEKEKAFKEQQSIYNNTQWVSRNIKNSIQNIENKIQAAISAKERHYLNSYYAPFLNDLNKNLDEAKKAEAAAKIPYDIADEEKKVADKEVIEAQKNLNEGEELGGFIEKEENLSQEGDCWVADNAKVYGNARIFGDAIISDNAKVYDNAQISDNSRVFDSAKVYGNAQVYGVTREFNCPNCNTLLEFSKDRTRLLKKLEGAEKTLKKAQDEDARLEQILNDAIKLKDEQNAKNDKLKETQNSGAETIKEILTEIEGLNVEIDNLNAEIEGLNVEIDNLNSEIDSLREAEIDIAKIFALTVQINALKNQINTRTAQISTLTAQIDTLRNQIDEIEAIMNTPISEFDSELIDNAEKDLNDFRANGGQNALQDIMNIKRALVELIIECYGCKIKWNIIDRVFCPKCLEELSSDGNYSEYERLNKKIKEAEKKLDDARKANDITENSFIEILEKIKNLRDSHENETTSEESPEDENSEEVIDYEELIKNAEDSLSQFQAGRFEIETEYENRIKDLRHISPFATCLSCDENWGFLTIDKSEFIGSPTDDNVLIFGNAEVYGTAKVYNNAQINGITKAFGEIRVFDNAKVQGGVVCGLAQIYGDAIVTRKVSNVERVTK